MTTRENGWVCRLVCWLSYLPHYTAVIVTITLIVVLVTR